MEGISIKMSAVKMWADAMDLNIGRNSAIYVLKEYIKANAHNAQPDEDGGQWVPVPTLKGEAELHFDISDDGWWRVDYFEESDVELEVEYPTTTCSLMYRNASGKGRWYMYTDVDERVTFPVTEIRTAAKMVKKYVRGRIEVRVVVNAS